MFRTRWSVSSDSVLHDRTPREGTGPVRFSTRCPNSDYLGFQASPEAIGTAAKKAEEVGFDAIFVNDHIIVDEAPRAASWTNVWDPFVAMSFIAAHTMARFGPLGRVPLKDVVFQDQWRKPYPGGRCGAHCHVKRCRVTGADSAYEEGGV